MPLTKNEEPMFRFCADNIKTRPEHEERRKRPRAKTGRKKASLGYAAGGYTDYSEVESSMHGYASHLSHAIQQVPLPLKLPALTDVQRGVRSARHPRQASTSTSALPSMPMHVPGSTANQHMQRVGRRMQALPNIVCRAANGDFYLLSMNQWHPPPPPPHADASAAAHPREEKADAHKPVAKHSPQPERPRGSPQLEDYFTIAPQSSREAAMSQAEAKPRSIKLDADPRPPFNTHGGAMAGAGARHLGHDVKPSNQKKEKRVSLMHNDDVQLARMYQEARIKRDSHIEQFHQAKLAQALNPDNFIHKAHNLMQTGRAFADLRGRSPRRRRGSNAERAQGWAANRRRISDTDEESEGEYDYRDEHQYDYEDDEQEEELEEGEYYTDSEEEEDPEGEESDDDAERVFDDVYQDACKRLKIPQLSTVIKESQKHTANLDYLYLKLKGSTALAAGLPYNYTMRTLHLRGNNMNGDAMQLLVAGLVHNHSVTSLDLSKNPLGDTGAQHLGELLSIENKHDQTLVELVMNECQIDDPGIAALAFCLSLGNDRLRALRLTKNKISDAGAMDLADLLRTCKSSVLQELDLDWNSIGATGAKALSISLKENCPLRKLALGWNGLETKGGSFICSVLGWNNHLEELDLSHTRSGPEVCLVVCEALSRNTVLKVLHLDGNPLGADGGRHLMWGLHTSKSLKTLSMKGSVFASEGPVGNIAGYASLNLQHPDGYYQLDMAQPAQRAVARQLIIINRKMGQNNIRECKLNGKPVGILKVEDFLADMPEIGKLDFRFQSKIAGDGNQVILARDKEINAVLKEFEDAHVSNSMRSALLTVITTNYFFTCKQACAILRTFDVGFEQVDAAVMIFMRTVDTENFEVVLEVLNDQSYMGVMRTLGERILFRYKNPTGHYRLDLSKTADRLLAATLKELLLSEQDMENWRNVEWSSALLANLKKPPPEWNGVIPNSGMLTIDFVSLDKERLQARHVKPMRPREFKALCWALFGFNFSNCHNNKENIIFLRKMSVRVYFSCEQLRELTRGLTVSSARTELVVMLYSRLCDYRDFWKVLYVLEAWEQASVMRRLGASACFFASHPSLHYVLTCAHPAERDLARHLCLKAVENQEIQNIHNLRIDGRSVKIREDKSLWQVILTSGANPMLEFDFLGSDWPTLLVNPDENLEKIKNDAGERDNRVRLHAHRMEFQRMRAMQVALMTLTRAQQLEQQRMLENSLQVPQEQLTKDTAVEAGAASSAGGDQGKSIPGDFTSSMMQAQSIPGVAAPGDQSKGKDADKDAELAGLTPLDPDTPEEDDDGNDQDQLEFEPILEDEEVQDDDLGQSANANKDSLLTEDGNALKNSRRVRTGSKLKKPSSKTRRSTALQRMKKKGDFEGGDLAWQSQWAKWIKQLVEVEVGLGKKNPVAEWVADIKDKLPPASQQGFVMPTMEMLGNSLKDRVGSLALPMLRCLAQLTEAQDAPEKARPLKAVSVADTAHLLQLHENKHKNVAVLAGLSKDRVATAAEITHLLVYIAPMGGLACNRFSASIHMPPPPLPFDAAAEKAKKDKLSNIISRLGRRRSNVNLENVAAQAVAKLSMRNLLSKGLAPSNPDDKVERKVSGPSKPEESA